MVQEIVEKQVDNSDNLTEQEKEQIKEEKHLVTKTIPIQLKHHKKTSNQEFSSRKTQCYRRVNTIQHLYIFQKRN